MKLFSSNRFHSRMRRAAFTIIEMWVSMAIGSMCLGACSVIYVVMAKEHRIGLADSIVQERIDNLEDKLTQYFQTMSATSGATLSAPASTNSSMYRMAVVSKGGASPQERLIFLTDTATLYYDPNSLVSGDEKVFWTGETNKFVLRDLYFTLGLKEGYRPDGSILNVNLIMDDDKASRRRSGANYTTSTVKRTFSIRLRGP